MEILKRIEDTYPKMTRKQKKLLIIWCRMRRIWHLSRCVSLVEK